MTLHADAPPVVWVLISTTHYHHARMSAFARAWPGQSAIVELTDTDLIPALEARRESAPYARFTLMPGVPTSRVRGLAVAGPLGEALERLRPGVVCINGWSEGGAREALRWSVRNGVGAVLMSESGEEDHGRRRIKEWVKGRILGLCSTALVGGSPHAAYLQALGFPRDRIFDGYDAVDNAHFETGAAAARREPEAHRARLSLPADYFVAASRFGDKKNLPRVLKAYAQYRSLAGNGAWDFVLFGDGELRPELMRLGAELGVERSFHMPGFASYDDLPACYALSRCFLHASTTEQWGLVVNEAMAAGAPVLVSKRCGCCADLVRDGVNGYSFDPSDTRALAGLMLSCHRDAGALEVMGRAGAAIIRDWGPARFARGLSNAAEAALRPPRRLAGLADRALLAAVTRT